MPPVGNHYVAGKHCSGNRESKCDIEDTDQNSIRFSYFGIVVDDLFRNTMCLHSFVSCISLRKQNRELQKRQDMNEATERTIRIHLKHQNNFILTIAIVCFISGVSILPELTMTFIISLNATTRSEQATEYVIPSYYVWGLVGFGVNCAIKVFVYIWRLSKYRKALKKLYYDC